MGRRATELVPRVALQEERDRDGSQKRGEREPVFGGAATRPAPSTHGFFGRLVGGPCVPDVGGPCPRVVVVVVPVGFVVVVIVGTVEVVECREPGDVEPGAVEPGGVPWARVVDDDTGARVAVEGPGVTPPRPRACCASAAGSGALRLWGSADDLGEGTGSRPRSARCTAGSDADPVSPINTSNTYNSSNPTTIRTAMRTRARRRPVSSTNTGVPVGVGVSGFIDAMQIARPMPPEHNIVLSQNRALDPSSIADEWRS